MKNFEEWKMHFTYNFILFLISIKTPEEYWFNIIKGELSPWITDELLDWETVDPKEAVKEAISYWEE